MMAKTLATIGFWAEEWGNSPETSHTSRLVVAEFEQTGAFFHPSLIVLENRFAGLGDYGLVAVIMGMHQMQKRVSAAADTST